MKQAAAFGLIIVLSIQCFYNLGIVAYFNLNREYVAEVLCVNKSKPGAMCQGQCFLERNLTPADQSGPETTAPAPHTNLEFPIFLVTRFVYDFSSSPAQREFKIAQVNDIFTKHLKPAFRPPAV